MWNFDLIQVQNWRKKRKEATEKIRRETQGRQVRNNEEPVTFTHSDYGYGMTQ